MSKHKHSVAPGTTFFFTIRLADRQSDLLVRRIDDLRRAMRVTLLHHPFQINAIAVLPSVIHTLWTLPDGDEDHAKRVAMLKNRFSRRQDMPAHRSLTQIKRGDKGIWQRHFWEHEISDADDFERHRDLIYLSPVHAGLCPRPQDWPHSSLRRDQLRRVTPPASVQQIPEHQRAAGLAHMASDKEQAVMPT